MSTANTNDIGVKKINGMEGITENTIIAPNPAPAEIPSNPGSAKLFLNSDCKIMPEQESAAPTIIALRVLGNLYSKIIFFSVSFADVVALNNSMILIEVEPIKIETIIDTNKIKKNTIIIVVFLFNYTNFDLK